MSIFLLSWYNKQCKPMENIQEYDGLRELKEEEVRLEAERDFQNSAYSGLKDIGISLALSKVKLSIALGLMANMQAGGDVRRRHDQARKRSKEAVSLLEELFDEISFDREQITADPVYRQVRDLLEKLVLRGGAAFFEEKIEDIKKAKTLARVVTRAVGKYLKPDDRYVPLFQTERLPDWLRSVVKALFYVLAPEHQQEPPYGTDVELEYSSERMTLPLSQAVHYLENEILPGLEEELERAPGSPLLQFRIDSTRQRIDEYRRLKFIPRANPIFPEQGFHNQDMTGYTADGEMLVTLALPVRFKSGTNLDRLQELVQAAVVRNLAGKGFSSVLDREYRRLKKVESGKRGSSRTPSFKLGVREGFRELRKSCPGLICLADKREFERLVDLVREGRKPALKTIEKLLTQSTGLQTYLP